MAQAGKGGHFDDSGFPVGTGWDEIPFPAVNDEHAYGLEISGDTMTPAYHEGGLIIVSPAAPIRRGDRVVVKTRGGEVIVNDSSAAPPSLRVARDQSPALGPYIAGRDVLWMARVVWASQ